MRYPCFQALLVLGLSSWGIATAGETLTPAGMAAAGCQTPPLREAELRQFLTSTMPTTPEGWIRSELPEGAPASAEVQAEIAITVQELVECTVTADPLRMYANYSRAYLTERRDGVLQDLSQPAEEREPTPDIAGLYKGPWHVGVLPDGRVSALLWTVQDDPHPAPGKVAAWIFVWEDGRWRVDDVIDVIAPPGERLHVYVADLVDGPPAATPSPQR